MLAIAPCIVVIVILFIMGVFPIFFFPLGVGTVIRCNSMKTLWLQLFKIYLVNMISPPFNGLEAIDPIPAQRFKLSVWSAMVIFS